MNMHLQQKNHVTIVVPIWTWLFVQVKLFRVACPKLFVLNDGSVFVRSTGSGGMVSNVEQRTKDFV